MATTALTQTETEERDAQPQVNWLAPAGTSSHLETVLKSLAPKMAEAMPRHFTAERMIQIAVHAARNNNRILQCTTLSIVGAVMEASHLGLRIGGAFPEAHLVPFWRRPKTGAGRLECQMIPDYKGVIKLAKTTPDLTNIWAEVVREGEPFDHGEGTSPFINHQRRPECAQNDVLAAYAVAHTRGGIPQFTIMWRSELDAVKARSKSKDQNGNIVGPWVTDEPEMQKKTTVKRLGKMLGLEAERFSRVLELDNEAEMGVRQSFGLGLTDASGDLLLPDPVDLEPKPKLENLMGEKP